MMTTSPDVTEDTLTGAIDAARTRAEQVHTTLQQRTREQQRLFDTAIVAEAEREQLETRRRALLLPAMQQGEAAARAELEQLPARIAATDQRARDAREAAALLQPGIDELVPVQQAAARALREAEYAVVKRDHDAETAALIAAFDALQPRLVAWAASDQHLTAEHRATFGEPRRVDYLPLRLMRFWSVRSREMFTTLLGPDIDVSLLAYHFPADSGTLD